jgi:hypothetical protein
LSASAPACQIVITGLDPVIHAFSVRLKTWMAGTSPAMTKSAKSLRDD